MDILYIVVFAEYGNKNNTYFQKFRRADIELSFVTNDIIANLPSSLEELGKQPKQIADLRRKFLTSYNIIKGPVDGLLAILNIVAKERPIVIIAERSIYQETQNICLGRQVLIKSFELTKDYVLDLALRDTEIAEFFCGSSGKLARSLERLETECDTLPGHYITSPNYLTLLSLGYILPSIKPFSSMIDEDFASIILRSVELVKQASVDPEAPPRKIIVSCPSVAWGLYKGSREFINKVGKSNSIRKGFLNSILRKAGYIHRVPMEQDSDFEKIDMAINGELSASTGQLMLDRRLELKAFASFCAVHAASRVTPVYRLPELQSRLYGPLLNLGRAAKSDTVSHINRRKLNKCSIDLSNAIKRSVPSSILEAISKQNDVIRFFGDFPLELLEVDGIPLGLKTVFTRIPTVPGSLFAQHGLRQGPIQITLKSVCKVLVIRALEQQSPLLKLVESAIIELSKVNGGHIDLIIEEVSTEQQFWKALSDFNGAILVFDGHGGYDETNGSSYLVVGKSRISHDERVEGKSAPPIVFLSACNTHSLEGSSLSVVNAFLDMGAFTVIGTSVPVDGGRAAQTIRRLLSAVDRLEIVEVNRPMNWAYLVTFCLRLQYLAESISVLSTTFSIERRTWDEIEIECSEAIFFRNDWYSIFTGRIADATKIPHSEVKSLILSKAYFTDASAYTQFGIADEIFIIRTNEVE